MKLTELLQKLTEIAEDLEESDIDCSQVDVLAGVQPSYPLTNVISGVISGEVLADYCDERPIGDDERAAIWIAVSPVHGGSKYSAYAPRPLWDAVGNL